MPEPLLRLDALSYRYPGSEKAALECVDLEVSEGEFILLAGASASGKSTLLRAASALVPHFFGGELVGRVQVGGLDTGRVGPAEVAEVASSVFQDPESQVVMNTVRAELALPLENRGEPSRAVARAVEETSLALGIEDLLGRSVDTLSGGELQRVALGAALVTRPRLLLLDEPTSQLDPVAGDELVWQLRRLNEEWGTTVVLAEQRLERCLAAVDRVVVLERGNVALDSSPRDFVALAASRYRSLAPPLASMWERAGLRPIPVGVKEGRKLIRARGLADPVEQASPARDGMLRPRRRFLRRRREHEPAFELDRVWVEYDDGSGAGLTALRGLELKAERGETLALLGRNGAGKSTLLRLLAGICEARRGQVRAAGDVALVVQNPGDYLLHERVRDELPDQFADSALEDVGLCHAASANPRDLSGSERQRLAIAIVLAGRGLGGGAAPAVVALDEPTRGMDREHKYALSVRLRGFAEAGSAVIVATQDIEFAARVADRSVLLAEGRVIADAATRDLLSGGRYFATDVARVLGSSARAVLPEEGARWLRDQMLKSSCGPDAGASRSRVELGR